VFVIACSGPSLRSWLDAGLRRVDCVVNHAAMVLDCDWLSCMDEPYPEYVHLPAIGIITRPKCVNAHRLRCPSATMVDAYGFKPRPYFSSEAALRFAMTVSRDIAMIGCDLRGDSYACAVPGFADPAIITPQMRHLGLDRWTYERRVLAGVFRDARRRGIRVRRLHTVVPYLG
jgi:hypothetical protein